MKASWMARAFSRARWATTTTTPTPTRAPTWRCGLRPAGSQRFGSLTRAFAGRQWTRTAILFIPFEGGEDSFVVRFDPETGLVDMLESMRYRDPGQGKSKILWITRNEPGVFIPGTKISAVGSATWLDQGKPWAFFSVEEMAYNLDVSAYIRARGE